MIRKALPEDLDELLEIEKESFVHVHVSKRMFLYAIANDQILVVEKDDEVVSYLVATRVSTMEGAYISNLATAEFHRMEGHAGDLLDASIHQFKEDGLENVALHVSVKNKDAIELYKQKGFQKTDVVKDYYDKNSDAYLMELSLTEKE
jgi:ribosomal protein S18 acetylase RimI-like enzyme